MQMVIDIPEEEYKCVQITGCIGNKTCIANAICNGTPLPKGHGRLIDADALKVSKHPTLVKYQYINEFFPNEPVCEYTEYYRCDTIRNAPTIIEADKEVEDDNNLHQKRT